MSQRVETSDIAIFDDGTRRFTLLEYSGQNLSDNTQILGPRINSGSRGSYRTAAKPMSTIDLLNPYNDDNTAFINTARRAGNSVLGILYSTLGPIRPFYAGEFTVTDVPRTIADEQTTSLSLISQTPLLEDYYLHDIDFTTDPTELNYFADTSITSGTAITLTNYDPTRGNPVFIIDISSVANLAANPNITVELAITGATGSPWTLTTPGDIRGTGGIYIANFNRAPVDFDTHANIVYASNADADAIASAAAAATTVELTLNNFSGTRSDTVLDLYVAREVRRRR